MKKVEPCAVLARGLAPSERCEGCEGAHHAQGRHFAAGTVLAAQGSPAEHLFLVIEGFVKEELRLDNGRTQLVRVLGPGEVAGMEALSRPSHQTTISTLCLSRVCLVPMTEFAERAPQQSAVIQQFLIEQIDELRASLVRLGAMSANERVRDTVLQFLKGTPPQTWMRLPLSRTELAELLGVSVGSVSRALRDMVRAGEIEVSGRRMRTSAPREVEQAAASQT